MAAEKKPSAASAVLAKLASSCLDADDAEALMICEADSRELTAVGFPAGLALELPYFKANGKLSGFKRWRYLAPTRTGFDLLTDKKDLRYVQPPGTLQELYMPPIVDWAAIQRDTNVRIAITEGELKAACCTKFALPCLGLGGVWSFKSSGRGLPLLPVFAEFEWVNREIVVVFDSDARLNSAVVAARNELCHRLLALGALPLVADLKPGKGGVKQGLDDLVLHGGAEALEEVLSTADWFAAAAALYELNAEVAYVVDPGLMVVVESGLKMRANDFVNHAYANRHYSEQTLTAAGVLKTVVKKAAPAWLEWPLRMELTRVVYTPGAERVTPGREYNTWPGWGCRPNRGSVAPWRALLDHLFAGDAESRSWFERWCALPLQQPGAKMYTAAVLWGVRTGTGKSLVGATLSRIYGANYALIGDAQLQDQRNEWAQNKQFVMGDDVTGHDQRRYADRLKAMITQEFMRIDPKYVPSFSVRDCINYLFTSNHPDAFFLEDDDRRNFVHEVARGPAPVEFYRDYMEWLNVGGGAEALFYYLLRLDLRGLRAEDRAPDTASRRSMVEDGLSDLGRWVRRLRDSPGHVLRVGDVALAGDLWSSLDLVRLYDPEGRGRATAGGVGRELKRAGMRQVYGGMPLATHAGQTRLFAVRNAELWGSAKGPALVTHYDMTRGNVRQLKRKKF